MLETFEENDVQTIYSGVSPSSFLIKQRQHRKTAAGFVTTENHLSTLHSVTSYISVQYLKTSLRQVDRSDSTDVSIFRKLFIYLYTFLPIGGI